MQGLGGTTWQGTSQACVRQKDQTRRLNSVKTPYSPVWFADLVPSVKISMPYFIEIEK